MGFMGLFKKSNNSVSYTDTKNSDTKKVKGKVITLQLKDKHEPFGAIDIADIKQALEEEDFAQLQSLYFFMMRDVKISSAILSRKNPLLSLPYKIETENKDFAEFIKNHIDLDTLVNGLTHGIYYGVSLLDVDYQVIEQKLAPRFRHISSRYLYADREDGKLKPTIDHLYIKQGSDKLYLNKLAPERTIFHKHPIDIGEITDFSLASKLVWYFSLKHITIAHNMQYFDAVATPPLIAKTSGDEDEIVETLYSLKSTSVGAFDKEDDISYLTLPQGSKTDFLNFITYIDSQITTLILGNTLSTGDGKNGSYSQSKIHENRQKELQSFDARLIAKTITNFLNQLEQMNYNSTKGVRFSFDLSEKKDLKELSEVVSNLSTAGFEIDIDDIETQFGFKVSKKAEPNNPSLENNAILTKTTHAQVDPLGSDKQETLPKDELDKQKTDTQAVENALLSEVKRILNHTTSYNEAYQALFDAYPDMDISTLEQSFFNIIGNSKILADAEVQLEEDDPDVNNPENEDE